MISLNNKGLWPLYTPLTKGQGRILLSTSHDIKISIYYNNEPITIYNINLYVGNISKIIIFQIYIFLYFCFMININNSRLVCYAHSLWFMEFVKKAVQLNWRYGRMVLPVGPTISYRNIFCVNKITYYSRNFTPERLCLAENFWQIKHLLIIF